MKKLYLLLLISSLAFAAGETRFPKGVISSAPVTVDMSGGPSATGLTLLTTTSSVNPAFKLLRNSANGWKFDASSNAANAYAKGGNGFKFWNDAENTALLTLTDGGNLTAIGRAAIGADVPQPNWGLIVSGAGLTGSTQVGIGDDTTYSTAGSANHSFFSAPSISTHSVSALNHFLATNATTSSGGAINTETGFYMPGSGTSATNSALFADNTAYSGHWFINQSGTLASTFGGAVSLGGTLTLGTDLIAASGSSGTSGQVLTSQGAGSVPKWTAVAGVGTLPIANGGTGATTAAAAVTALGAAPALAYLSSSASTNVSAGNNTKWIAHATSITTPNITGGLWKVSGSFYANGSATTIAMSTVIGQWSTADGAGTSLGSPPAIIVPTFGNASTRFDDAIGTATFNYPLTMPEIIVGPNITVYLTPYLAWSGAGSVTNSAQVLAIRIQ